MSHEQTVAFAVPRPESNTKKRSLVQIHPLDLNRRPIELNKNRMVLGRSGECDVQIIDDAASRQHAEIRSTDGGLVLLDLESTNGVTVNGVVVKAHGLSSGDCIQVGSHVFRFLADDDQESQYHATVYSMMTRDGLTGIYNRRYLEETLHREVARCKRYSRPIAAIEINVDNFVEVNNRYGFTIGDQVLRSLAQRLDNILRTEDVLARSGGDEFTIVMVEADVEHAAEIAERCRVAVASEPMPSSVGPISISISLGVAGPPPSNLGTSEELLSEARERLVEAKRAGQNRTVC